MSGQTRRALVVEDDPIVLRGMAGFLENIGFSVTRAEDGEVGARLFREGGFDLVLTDLRMPKLGGLELIKIVAAAAPCLPVIVVSGADDLKDAVASLKQGAWDYLAKPIMDMDELRRVIDRAFERAEFLKERLERQERLEREVASRTALLQQELEARKSAEQALRQSQRLENEAKAHLTDVFNSLPSLLATLTPDNEVERWNPAAERYTGVSAAEAHGNVVWDARLLPFLKFYQEDFATARDGGAPKFFNSLNIRFHDATRAMNLSVIPLPASGRRLLLRLDDITALKEKDEKLRQAQKMEAIGNMAGGIAHDFNNILMSIIGYCEMARECVTDTDLVTHCLESMLKSSKRGADLTRQILTFCRKDKKEPKPINLGKTVEDTIRLIKVTMPESVKIALDIQDHETKILADPSETHQVISNICHNAVHAMRGMEDAKLAVSVRPLELDQEQIEDLGLACPGKYLELSVADNGYGIPKELQARIFEPFFTTKPANEGTGMGLAIVHGIVKRLNGCVSIDSAVGKGTAFKLLLPAEETADEAMNHPRRETRGAKERILLVDDEELLLDLYKMILESLNYEVTPFVNPKRALEAFTADPAKFNLLLTDQAMPGMSGSDLAERAMRLRPDLPVILCTGYSNSIDAEQARNLGIKNLIYKPIYKDDLAELIKSTLHPAP